MTKMRQAGIVLILLSGLYRTVLYLVWGVLPSEYTLMSAGEQILTDAAPILISATIALYIPSIGGTLALAFSFYLVCLGGYSYYDAIFVTPAQGGIVMPSHFTYLLLERTIPTILLLLGGVLVLIFSKPLVWIRKEKDSDKTGKRLRLAALAWGIAGMLGSIAFTFLCSEEWRTYLCHCYECLVSQLFVLGAGIWFAWGWSAFWGGVLLVAMPAAWLISFSSWFIFLPSYLPLTRQITEVVTYWLPQGLSMLPSGVLFLLSRRKPAYVRSTN